VALVERVTPRRPPDEVFAFTRDLCTDAIQLLRGAIVCTRQIAERTRRRLGRSS
jgi:hypothetical protein